MLPSFAIGDKILKRLLEIDEATSARVAKWGCLHCTGPLHRADYPRKPRGGLLAVFGEGYSTRISLCCGWEGCRRRATPPSVRFLGRRVYLGVVVMVASIFANTTRAPGEVKRTTGIPRRTVNRWRKWWRSGFVKSRLFEEERGRFVPPLEIEALPTSLVERFFAVGRDAADMLDRSLRFLAPLTTQSVANGGRFVREL